MEEGSAVPEMKYRCTPFIAMLLFLGILTTSCASNDGLAPLQSSSAAKEPDWQVRPILGIAAVAESDCEAARTPGESTLDITVCGSDNARRYRLAPSIFEAESVVAGSLEEAEDGCVISMQLDARGTQATAKASKRMSLERSPRNEVAVVSSGKVVSVAPLVSPVFGGVVSMSLDDRDACSVLASSFAHS